MLDALLGQGSMAARLRDGLDASSGRIRRISHRVANAANGVDGRGTGAPGAGDFPGALERAGRGEEPGEVDLQEEMTRLADEQIRYDASARLLREVYGMIRTSVRGS